MKPRRRSLYLSFAVGSAGVVLVLLAGLVASRSTLGSLREELHWLSYRALPLLNQSEQMLQVVAEMENGVQGFALSGDWLQLKPFQRARTRWPKLLEEARGLVDRPEDAGTLDELDSIIQGWLKDVGQKYIELREKIDEGEADMADLQSFVDEEDSEKYVTRARALLQELAQRQQERAEDRFEEVIAASRWSTALALSTIAFALAAVIFATLFLGRNVAARLGRLRAALLSVGEGARVRTDVGRDDEIGDVERAFNRMVDLVDAQTRTIEEKLAELARAYRMKSQFLSTMSHELRTPLNSIIGFSDLVLADASTPEGPRRSIEVVRRNAGHLREIIDDVLDLARLESGRMEVRHAPTDVVALLRTCLATIHPLAAEKKLAVRFTEPAGVGPVETDASKVRQILLNLLSNAVKFTDAGEILVEVQQRADELRVAVADTGIGMPPEALSIIFEEFRQLDSGEGRRFGGSGLGLTLSRKLARALGGELEVESTAGEGSRFTLRLPRAAAREAA